MNVGRLEQLILEELGRTDQDFPIDGRVAMVRAEAEMGNLIKQLLDAGQQVPEGYFAPFILDITTDTDTGYKVAQLNTAPMVIGTDWIRQVGAAKDFRVSYTVMTQGQFAQVQNTEVADNAGNPGVFYQYGKFYFINIDPNVTQVRALYIPQISMMDEDDTEFGDSSIEKMIVDNTVRALMFKKVGAKVDKAQDNVSQ